VNSNNIAIYNSLTTLNYEHIWLHP